MRRNDRQRTEGHVDAVQRIVPLGETLAGGAAAIVTADDGHDYAVIVARQTINGPIRRAELRSETSR